MSLTVFTYHRIQPREHPDALTVDVFERQLDFIQANFEILAPASALGFIEGKTDFSAQKNRRMAMLSFDDGWLDNWLFATPILKKRNLTAALALSAGFLHDGKLREHAEDVPEKILRRRNLDAEKLAPNGDTLCYCSREEIRAMQNSDCWSIEAHGTRHLKNSRGISFLAAPDNGVSSEEFEKLLRDDLKNCIDEITIITARAPKMLFYPWGQFSTLSAKTAKSLGFRAQFSTEKGCILHGDSRLVLPRVNAAANWEKFTRNASIFSRPLLAKIHGIFAHTEKLCFD